MKSDLWELSKLIIVLRSNVNVSTDKLWELPQKNTCCIGKAHIVLVFARLNFFQNLIFLLIGSYKTLSRFGLKREKMFPLNSFG